MAWCCGTVGPPTAWENHEACSGHQDQATTGLLGKFWCMWLKDAEFQDAFQVNMFHILNSIPIYIYICTFIKKKHTHTHIYIYIYTQYIPICFPIYIPNQHSPNQHMTYALLIFASSNVCGLGLETCFLAPLAQAGRKTCGSSARCPCE